MCIWLRFEGLWRRGVAHVIICLDIRVWEGDTASQDDNFSEIWVLKLGFTCLIKLKEKLPQAFMQMGWMEDDFRNLTAKVWANLDNPIKRYDFQRFHYFRVCRPLRWHSSNICDVTTVQLSNGTVHNFFKQNFTFYENVSSLFFYTYTRYVIGLRWMCMHSWMNLIKRTINIQEQLKIVKKKSMYKVNGELSSCDITYSGRVPSREGDIYNFA